MQTFHAEAVKENYPLIIIQIKMHTLLTLIIANLFLQYNMDSS